MPRPRLVSLRTARAVAGGIVGVTPLALACTNGHAGIVAPLLEVRTLLAAGADLDEAAQRGRTGGRRLRLR